MPATRPEDFRAELRRIAARLIAPTEDYESIRFELRRFHDLCAECTGIRGTAGRDQPADLLLPGGTAISPAYAACTVFDWLRTRRFVYGLHLAIQAARQAGFSPVHILYAGCGPFATLALPLMSILPASAAVWTILEIQPASRRAADHLFHLLGFEDRILSLAEADATVYRHTGPPFQILVSETMQNLLATEPQVAISRNLVPQLGPDGRLIPEEIRVDIFIADFGKEFNSAPFNLEERPPRLEPLGTLIQLNAKTAAELSPRYLSENRFPIPAYCPWLSLRMQMTVQIFREIRLEEGNSPLSIARSVPEWREHPEAREIIVAYRSGPFPGLRYRFA